MKREQTTPLTIGLPVYNGESHLREALDSINAQTFTDYKLIISDNASTDSTPKICQQYALADRRISYIRHEKNNGASRNFLYVLAAARSPYFMWAACDDLWENTYIEKCLEKLGSNTGIALVSSLTVPFGSDFVGESYKSLALLPGATLIKTRLNYLCQPEEQGKANIIYGIYRTDILLSVTRKYGFGDGWGADMLLVYRCLTRGRLLILEEPLFYKRQPKIMENSIIPEGLSPKDHEKIALSALAAKIRDYFPYYRTYICVEIRQAHEAPWQRFKLALMAAKLFWKRVDKNIEYLIKMVVRHRRERAKELEYEIKSRIKHFLKSNS